MYDIRDHGGALSGGKYRKGSKIPLEETNLGTPKFLPVIFSGPTNTFMNDFPLELGDGRYALISSDEKAELVIYSESGEKISSTLVGGSNAYRAHNAIVDKTRKLIHIAVTWEVGSSIRYLYTYDFSGQLLASMQHTSASEVSMHLDESSGDVFIIASLNNFDAQFIRFNFDGTSKLTIIINITYRVTSSSTRLNFNPYAIQSPSEPNKISIAYSSKTAGSTGRDYWGLLSFDKNTGAGTNNGFTVYADSLGATSETDGDFLYMFRQSGAYFTKVKMDGSVIFDINTRAAGTGYYPKNQSLPIIAIKDGFVWAASFLTSTATEAYLMKFRMNDGALDSYLNGMIPAGKVLTNPFNEEFMFKRAAERYVFRYTRHIVLK